MEIKLTLIVTFLHKITHKKIDKNKNLVKHYIPTRIYLCLIAIDFFDIQ